MCITANVLVVARTNIEIDEDVMRRVMDAYSFKSMREAVDFALRELIEPDIKDMLELRGIGWEGDLDVLRGKKRRQR
jgi:Arc/MetJ family transcription regulator